MIKYYPSEAAPFEAQGYAADLDAAAGLTTHKLALREDSESSELRKPWPELVPLTRPAPPSLDLECAIPANLPLLRDFVTAQARALQVSPDAVALLSVGIASLAASRTFEVEPRPGWRETAPLWTVALAAPGERKSALLAALTAPVHQWGQAEREHLRHSLATYAESRRATEARAAHVRSQLAKAPPENVLQLQAESDSLARALEDLPELVAPVLTSSDCTPEAARDALAANGEKLGFVSAEVDAGKIMGSRYAKNGGANVDLFLSAWIGDQCPALRVGRSIPLSRPALAMILTVQPAAVREVLRDVAAHGRGLLDRFLFVEPPSLLGYRDLEPPPAPEPLAAWWSQAVHSVLDLPWPGRVILTANGPARSESPARIVRPDQEAAACLRALRQQLESRMKPAADLAPLAGFASKLPGQVVRIALAFHVLGNVDSETLTLPTMQAACAWAPFLIEHARAVRGNAAEGETVREARRLLAAIKRHGHQSVTARDCLRLVQGETVPTAEHCAPIIHELVERSYLREIEHPDSRGRGRPPSPTYIVNPATLTSS
jgi:hypothetical protein